MRRRRGNVFAELVNAVEPFRASRAIAVGDGGSLGQITGRLSGVVGKFRPMA